MDFFIGHPSRVLFVAVFFVLVALLSGKRADGIWGKATLPCYGAALVWMAYALWEYLVSREGADIRVDLLIIYPILIIVSVLAPILSFRLARRTQASKNNLPPELFTPVRSSLIHLFHIDSRR